MDWDSSRDDDAQTSSDDYNLHGASALSNDHPSVTRDNDFFNREDLNDVDYSIENADLIADIVDGKITHDHRARTTRGGHRTGDNSVDSIMRYMLNGLQDPEDYPAGGHNQYRDDRYEQGQGELDEDYGTVSSQTPNRQVRNILPKSPVVRRTLAPKPENVPKTRYSRSGSSDGLKPSAPRSGLRPPTIRSVPVPPPLEPAAEKPVDPKPVFRSALKPPNNIKSKLGRHIQLPKEILDSEDTDDMVAVAQQEPREITSKSSPQVITQEEKKEEDEKEKEPRLEIKLKDDPQVQPTPVPGPSRFTRITKKTASPGKKSVATIPTPLDDDIATKDDEDDKRVQRAVKDLRIMLGRLGLLPLSGTLDTSLDSLTASDVEIGGLCEMMGLLNRLGGMYEKQKEVIHQMTDQIIGGEMGQGSNPEVEKKLQESTRKLEMAQTQISEVEDRNRVLESQLETHSNEIEEMRNEIEELKNESEDLRNEIETMSSEIRDLKSESDGLRTEGEDLRNEIESMSSELGGLRSENEELKTESEGLRDEIEALLAKAGEAAPVNNETEREANWSTVEEHLQREEAKLLKRSTVSQQSTSSMHQQGDWMDHIQTIEKELQALKSMHSRHSSSLPRGDVEERLNDALLENRRLQTKNKSLTKELLGLHEERSAHEDKSKTIQKLKALLREVTVCLGIDNHQQIVPALTDIQKNMEELTTMRKFIAKTERIVWESEIADGSVKVQSAGSSNQETLPNGSPTNEGKKDYSSMKPGKTCSQSYESTLQRLREWSELLDVLNHVEFGEEGDNSSTATVKHATQ